MAFISFEVGLRDAAVTKVVAYLCISSVKYNLFPQNPSQETACIFSFAEWGRGHLDLAAGIQERP